MDKKFDSAVEARAWCASKEIDDKKFAAQNDLFCYTKFTNDLMCKGVIHSATVYSDDREAIESAYSKDAEKCRRIGVAFDEFGYHFSNNFEVFSGSGFINGNLIERTVF